MGPGLSPVPKVSKEDRGGSVIIGGTLRCGGGGDQSSPLSCMLSITWI